MAKHEEEREGARLRPTVQPSATDEQHALKFSMRNPGLKNESDANENHALPRIREDHKRAALRRQLGRLALLEIKFGKWLSVPRFYLLQVEQTLVGATPATEIA
jgi:hypothetical protein